MTVFSLKPSVFYWACQNKTLKLLSLFVEAMLSKTLTCTPTLFGRLQVNRRLPMMITRSGGGHHGPMMPPFARLQPPTSSVSWSAYIP